MPHVHLFHKSNIKIRTEYQGHSLLSFQVISKVLGQLCGNKVNFVGYAWENGCKKNIKINSNFPFAILKWEHNVRMKNTLETLPKSSGNASAVASLDSFGVQTMTKNETRTHY